jgi:hypothetical protein
MENGTKAMQLDTYHFVNEYVKAYPDESYDFSSRNASLLYKFFQRIESEYNVIVNGYGNYIPDAWLDRIKTSWLLYSMTPFKTFAEQLMHSMIKNYDSSFTQRDYVILFYISLQDKDVQDATRGLPMSILHGIFTPVMDENLGNWKKNAVQSGEAKKMLEGLPLGVLQDIFTPIAEENYRKWKVV